MAPLEHTAHRTLYTLTELCSLIGEALDDSLASSYWVKAEISSLSVKGGHMYLDLVDNQQSKIASKMRATCWSGTQENKIHSLSLVSFKIWMSLLFPLLLVKSTLGL